MSRLYVFQLCSVDETVLCFGQNFVCTVVESQSVTLLYNADHDKTPMGKLLDDLNLFFTVIFAAEVLVNAFAHWFHEVSLYMIIHTSALHSASLLSARRLEIHLPAALMSRVNGLSSILAYRRRSSFPPMIR
jgi:hypothetical protein